MRRRTLSRLRLWQRERHHLIALLSAIDAEAAKNYVPGGKRLSIAEIDERIGAMSLMRRPGYPEDIAGFVSLVASSE